MPAKRNTDLVLRALFMYGIVFLLTRVMVRRELSSFQPFDLILLVVIGDMVQQGVTFDDLAETARQSQVEFVGHREVGGPGELGEHQLHQQVIPDDDSSRALRKMQGNEHA